MPFRIDGMEIYAGRALIGKLRVRLRLRSENQRVLLLGGSGVLSIRSGGEPFVEIGELRMTRPEGDLELGRNRDSSCNLELLLTREMLQGIEEVRQGARLDLEFKISFWGMRLEGQEGPGFRLTLNHQSRIERSQWIEDFLPVFGWDTIELWEVRTGPAPKPGELEVERDLLGKALRDFNAGDYEDAFRDCREALESLKTRQQELGIEGLMGKQEWTRASGFLSIALHADNVIAGKVNRADAEFALTLTHAIYRRVAHAITNPKPSRQFVQVNEPSEMSQ